MTSMKSYSGRVQAKATPQSRPVAGKAEVQNDAGGFGFALDKWARLHRFLVLGAEGGTFYVGEQKLVEANAKAVVECLKEDGSRTVLEILDVSVSGRAPKNEPAIFALALATVYGDAATKATAYRAIPRVCRIGTHLFHFCQAVQDLRGWSRGLRGGVGAFYADRDEADLAYQLVKYRQRDGWTHKDVIKLAHPKTKDPVKNALIRWALGKTKEGDDSDQHVKRGPIIAAFEEVQRLGVELAGGTTTATQAQRIVREICELTGKWRLPWEALPTQVLASAQTWETLAPTMPLGALLRNLGRMSSLGLTVSNLSETTKILAGRLTDREAIRKARLHPLSILQAAKVYGQGHGDKGSLTWTAAGAIKDALEGAFYLSFDSIESTGKAWLLGIDVSGSMTSNHLAGMNVTAAEGAAVMSMITARKEAVHEIYGFDHGFVDLGVTAKDTLAEAIRKTNKNNGGGTDCALPMIFALENKLKVDAFVVYTDNETWAGKVHPFQALQAYRKALNPGAKLIVVGMTATGFTIADPSDAGMLDVVGFDPATPAAMADFVRG
ncbi:MAG: TROVE domain-containing protein [Actinomycetota bacterium]|nr:TROVE domain-containing protein [Actinomycetota bacterium]